jgi:glycosyltransferase involved in cell wall biosynthesis
MTIAFAFEIFYPTVNGVITSSVNLAENLIARGHRVVFIAPKTKEFQKPLIHDVIPVYYIDSSESMIYPGMRASLPWSRHVITVLKKEEVDVVHITGPWLLCAAAIRGARKLDLPIVHTFHTMLHEPTYIKYFAKFNLLVPVFQAIAWEYFKPYIRRSDVMTGPSKYACEELREHYPGADIRHISNGVDISRFESYAGFEETRRNYPPYNNRSFLFVGRLGAEKSVDQLVSAMHHVVGQLPDARLFIVGAGPGQERFENQARRLKLRKHVHFLGRIPHEELLESGLIQHARAFVTASVTENQPMTVIEAICCGVPIVVADVPGIRELLDGNGLLFPRGDVESLAANMVRIGSDDGLYGEFRSRSFAFRDRFDGRNVAKEFEGVYRELIRRAR